MRLAISNIAWDVSEDEVIADVLRSSGIDAIDIAPGKYFPDPCKASSDEITRVRQWWAGRGFEITGMQALLFGTTGLNLFGSQESQAAMLEHLRAVCAIAGRLGALRLVFGSPKNRDRFGLSDEGAMAIAIDFFRRLGDIAHAEGVVVCLEPNPVRYGANFMVTSEETARVVEAVRHPAILMQFDTGAVTLNNESPAGVLRRCAHLIGHIHASEPDLVPLGDGGTSHVQMHEALKWSLPSHIVSIEMAATTREPHVQSIQRALAVAARSYGPCSATGAA